MLSLSATGRVFFATTPVDLRKGFTGLVGVVRSVLDEDPLSGDVYRTNNVDDMRCIHILSESPRQSLSRVVKHAEHLLNHLDPKHKVRV